MIKRIIFSLFLFSIFSGTIYGQRFHAGLIAGISTTQVAGDQLSGFNKAGIIGGGFVVTPIGDKTSLQMEINFIQKGSRKPLQTDNNEFYVMRLSYFEVPVLFKWQIA